MISAYVDRFEGEKAVLLLGDEMTKVNFPQKYLPPEVGEGEYVKIEISPDMEMNERAEDEALSLLKDNNN